MQEGNSQFIAACILTCSWCCSDSMKRLFTAAGESSEAVQALLSPEQQSQELWKSARTQCVIQQEQAFKQMVFNQLLLTN